MAQKVQPGVYDATIVNYGITQQEGKAPQAAILFEYTDDEGDRHEVTWYGSFKEGKAVDITLKALLACGFDREDPAELAGGLESACLDVETPVSITLEEQEYQGKRYVKVQWVNTKRQFNSISQEDAKVRLGTMNLKGQLALIRQQTGHKASPRQRPQAQTPFAQDDDLPF